MLQTKLQREKIYHKFNAHNFTQRAKRSVTQLRDSLWEYAFTYRNTTTSTMRILSNCLSNPYRIVYYVYYLYLFIFTGVSRPRINSVTGTPLPSPRVVSTVIHPDISNLHTRYTLMMMQFAQFLDHELTKTPIHKGKCQKLYSN